MILADTTVLVYAFDADSPRHEAYAGWLSGTLGSAEEFALLDAVLTDFVRTVTHPAIMPSPAPTTVALEFLDAIISWPSARWLRGSSALWQRFASLAREDRALRGPLVSQGYIAAAALAHGARLATTDRSYARYTGLNFFDPLDKPGA